MFAATKTAEQRMIESVGREPRRQVLAYYMRADRRNEWVTLAEAEHAPERVVTWLKTASPNAATNASNIFAQAMDRFLSSKTPRGAFNSMRPGMTQVPFHTWFIGKLAAQELGESFSEANPPLPRKYSCHPSKSAFV